MNITLRQVEVFLHTASLGSLSQAAARLCLTQAAASMALKEFETQLGEKLFDRAGRRLILNENGRAAIPLASEIIGRALELEGCFRNEEELSGELVIGASSTIGNYVLPGRVADFLELNPLTRIRLEVGNTEAIIGQVLRFKVDVGFIEGHCTEPEIAVLPFMNDELVIFAAAGHRLAGRRQVDRRELEKVDWILREKGSGTREIFEQQINALSLNLRVRLELGHTEAIKNAVARGRGISCLSRWALEDLAQLGRIAFLNTPFLNLERKFYLILHRHKYRTTILNQFIGHLKTSLADHPVEITS